ncbi:lipoate--protein ligase family protein [Virgibacillus oceani]|uniref:Octanoyl-[GcvH]:protein N-octanoyltransferase n=1 Tax=Virgibacillus oceani TaxID=1479511 RepID=A0A917H8G8_9BACI|nr:lipoate--protein ligase family protein [Virgibacillus oceani]GGG70893.1 octanoyl-[GcvH]:protein N-octanoyltransferase [Virgibacillus oceani]
MQTWKEIIHHATFRYIDQSNKKVFNNEPLTALSSFAIDDALALSVSDGGSPPAIRLWVHSDTVVLGIPDARLPYIDEGIQLLQSHGYRAVVRNSGGLAVALDKGVLNISLILPGVKHLSIHACYEAMVSFIQYMLRDLTNEIEAYEIVGSYCPGDYDLSIGGRKFAGISQRRVKDGAAIQIYLDVEGNGRERAEMIRHFYEISHRGEKTKFDYPTVVPNTMASLSELLDTAITMEDMKRRVRSAIEDLSEKVVVKDFSKREMESYWTRLEQMKKRNQRIAEIEQAGRQ